jgi:hypothetical protein
MSLMTKRRLNVDMDEILDAMTFSDIDPVRFFLDLETGSVESRLRSEMYGEVEETDFDRLFEENPERFEEIPSYPGRDEYRLMSEFAEALDEDDIRSQLEIALQGKGAFRRFRNVLSRYPDLQREWLQRRQRAFLDEALAWFESIDVEPVYQLRPIEPEPATTPARRVESGPKITLLDMLLLGAPAGKTELIDGQVPRCFEARSPSHARSVFKNLAREICEYHGIAWRNRFIESTSRFDLERAHLEVDGTTVSLLIDVPPAVWRAFGG